jgi:hypothetical protein
MSAATLRRSAGPGTALLGLGLVLALMVWLQDELNPDWLGYAAIYQDAGAWLADQGRDPLFLLLMGTVSTLLGPDGYDTFRLALAGYFALFTFVLLRGRHVPAEGRPQGWPLLLLGLLPFVAPRFTIQIREGLALTLVLLGLLLLARRPAGPVAAVSSRAAPVGPALLLFAAGAALHSGTGVLLLALLGGLAVRHVAAGVVRLELWLMLSLGLLGVVATALIATVGLAMPAGRAFVDAWYGLLADEEATVSAAKWAYWGAYGLGVLTLAGQVRRLYERGELPAALRPVLGVVVLVMLPAIYVSALLLLGAGMPAIVVSGAARVMNMLLSVSLLVLALRGQLNWRLGLFCLLVLVDQARVILEAVLGAGVLEAL